METISMRTMVLESVKTLFSGYPDLINGFNAFLPTGYEIKALPGISSLI